MGGGGVSQKMTLSDMGGVNGKVTEWHFTQWGGITIAIWLICMNMCNNITVMMYYYYLCSYKYEEKKHVYVGFAPPPPPLRCGLCLSKCSKTSLMYIFWFIILFINEVTQGGGGLAKRWHWMTCGEGGVYKGPILGDIIYQQPLIAKLYCF